MARILIVHGISNQFSGESELLAAWHPALRDGLNRVGYSPTPAISECFCPFYGDIFRPEGRLGAGPIPGEEDLADANEEEIGLLAEIWVKAAESDSTVPSPSMHGETLFRFPRVAERALNALARSKYLADYLPLQFFGDLKQVVLYLNKSDLHRKILDRVLAAIEPGTNIVIGHSLGSVIAYEAVCSKPGNIKYRSARGYCRGSKTTCSTLWRSRSGCADR